MNLTSHIPPVSVCAFLIRAERWSSDHLEAQRCSPGFALYHCYRLVGAQNQAPSQPLQLIMILAMKIAIVGDEDRSTPGGMCAEAECITLGVVPLFLNALCMA